MVNMMIDKKSKAMEILKGLSMSDIRDLNKNFKSVECSLCPIEDATEEYKESCKRRGKNNREFA